LLPEPLDLFLEVGCLAQLVGRQGGDVQCYCHNVLAGVGQKAPGGKGKAGPDIGQRRLPRPTGPPRAPSTTSIQPFPQPRRARPTCGTFEAGAWTVPASSTG